MNEINSIVYGMDTLLGVMEAVARFPVAECHRQRKEGVVVVVHLIQLEVLRGPAKHTHEYIREGCFRKEKGVQTFSSSSSSSFSPSPFPPPPPPVLTPFLPGHHDVRCSTRVLLAITD